MAKHSKGKHSAPKVKKKDAAQVEEADAEQKIEASSSEKEAFPATSAKASPDSSSCNAEGTVSSQAIPQALDASSPSHDLPHRAVSQQPSSSEAAEHAQDPAPTRGKHAAVEISDTSDMAAYLGKHQNAASRKEERRQLREQRKAEKQRLKAEKQAQRTAKHTAKVVGVILGSICGGLAVLYLAGVAVFSFLFMPNTVASGMDLSWKSPEAVQEQLQDTIGTYSFKVKGEGLSLVVTSKEAGISLDGSAMTDAVRASQDPWRWPQQVFQSHDASAALADALSATDLAEVVQKAVDEVNAEAVDPVDATITFNEATSNFGIVAEIPGTKLDADAVLEDIIAGAMALEQTITLDESALVEPAVYRDDERLLTALDKANDFIKADLDLYMEGNPVTEIDAYTIYPWVAITPELEVTLDSDAVGSFAGEIAEQCNTVGSTRTYTRPDGKEITVSGGSYGWKVDSDALVGQLSEAILAGTVGQIEMPVLQSGTGFSEIGGQDWGTRYIDVDIAEQHARFYDGGQIIWESDFVSGARGKHDSPRGVYYLNSKASPTTLVGRKPNGEIDYETDVQYWMPFKGNSVGFHDATWQSAFGGSRYAQGFGSHGCINLPSSKARELYGIINRGDVVVVHG